MVEVTSKEEISELEHDILLMSHEVQNLSARWRIIDNKTLSDSS